LAKINFKFGVVYMNFFNKFTCIFLIFLVGCASGPQVVVDPKSIVDVQAYNKDNTECKSISEGYDAGDATTGSALLGAGVAVGTAALVLATGGMYLLGTGVAAAGGTGAAVGGGISKSREGTAREKIWADCLTGRGYKAYSSK
jgi:hypothetical protein